ncbi:hypothetical protein [Pedobacter sp. UYP30]|uniref:hypothetical protein n=1 Tax=Pedobacter sp. UYP30 TaxID=1756400 RepID=UPI003394EC3E
MINDLPLFIDPFLLFGSDKPEFQQLHNEILEYLGFLKTKSEEGITDLGQIKSWYCFPEVKQNWFGYSMVGNSGSGLGQKFGKALSANMHIVFHDLGNEKIPKTSHLEKAGLFSIGVGKDNISDFTCNLIKSYLLQYTAKFAEKHLKESQSKELMVDKAFFDYNLERWMPKKYTLPYLFNDYVLLTPKDILTKDDNWINSNDLHGKFDTICRAIPNDQLRSEIYNYFRTRLPRKKANKQPSQKERTHAIYDTINKFPKIIEYYIKYKETNKDGAKNISKEKVSEVETIFVRNVMDLIQKLTDNSEFYNIKPASSHDEALQRVIYMKDVIEKNDGYRFFYSKGQPIKREQDLQLIFKLTWYSSIMDVNREPNNGRGPVDYSISKGSQDKTLVEFKLASNTQLKRNLLNQVKIYEAANGTKKSIKVIIYFDRNELLTVTSILKELKLQNDPSIILIDARRDNKISASKV